MAQPQKRTSTIRSDNRGSNHGNDDVGNMAVTGDGDEDGEEDWWLAGAPLWPVATVEAFPLFMILSSQF